MVYRTKKKYRKRRNKTKRNPIKRGGRPPVKNYNSNMLMKTKIPKIAWEEKQIKPTNSIKNNKKLDKSPKKNI